MVKKTRVKAHARKMKNGKVIKVKNHYRNSKIKNPRFPISSVEPKNKKRQKALEKKEEKMDDIKRHISYLKELLKTHEKSFLDVSKKRDEYVNKSYEEPDSKEYYTNMAKKLLLDYKKKKSKYYKDIESSNNKLLAVELDYNKINKLVRNTLEKSNYTPSHQVRGYGTSSTGYEIRKPTVYEPEISIRWMTYWNTNEEKRKKSIKEFREKMIPVLKENDIKFSVKEEYITIKK